MIIGKEESQGRESIVEQYKKFIDIEGDDTLIMSSMLKMIRVNGEVNDVNSMFIDGVITNYEALLRLDVLLGFMDEIRKDVKARL